MRWAPPAFSRHARHRHWRHDHRRAAFAICAKDKLQPTMLSPLLGAVSRAEGAARISTATINWSPSRFPESRHRWCVDKLDFLTPLGAAHAVNATIVLSSLLPPVTAPGQHISISKRLTGRLPLSGIAMDFSFGGGMLCRSIRIGHQDFAEGNVKLGAFTVDLTGARLLSPALLRWRASRWRRWSLLPISAAKVKLEGKVTGTVPFSYRAGRVFAS